MPVNMIRDQRDHVTLTTIQDNNENTEESMSNSATEGDVEIQFERHSKWRLLSHLDLPEWLRGNPFLSYYHRPPMPSFGFCFKSIFKVHTETGNIWTHLIGFLAFVSITMYMFLRPITATAPYPKDWQEKLVFGSFFACGILCLGFSWIFHTVHCHSMTISRLFRSLDYSGIVLFIMGSFIPPLYYGFYCSGVLRVLYMSLACSLGTICIVVSLCSKLNHSKYRILRAVLLVAFGWSGIIPAIHLIALYGVHLVMRLVALQWMGLMSLLYTASAVTYATRIPERFLPGKCDIWFQSHQIFHVLVVIAAFVHLHAICEMARYRFDHGAACQP
ncbi:adiponectin receptor protein-like [Montipora capricornis]|uniref:adiponectin receptor protein-like n=1 Tax=Montipora capricornis TaxID=246305 RepID=UPI0035F17CE4